MRVRFWLSVFVAAAAGYGLCCTTAYRTALAYDPGEVQVVLPPSGPIQSQSMMIAASKSKDVVWAYSKHTGQWHKLSIRNRNGAPIEPVVAESVAFIAVGARAYAFSALNGSWDEADATDAAPAAVNPDWITFQARDRVFAFSAKSGRWESIDLR